MKPFKILLTVIATALLFASCDEFKYEYQGCPMFSIVPYQPYDDPVWHPSGEIIGFNYIPIKEIVYNYGYDCPMQASYTYENDSAGFYLVNADGTNQHRVLPYYLVTPAWSNDGKWIAFSYGGQIHKMPFDGVKFDTTAIEQLTFEGGSNFHPSWSPDDKWITYSQNICNETKCGVWNVNVDTKDTNFIALYGGYPVYYTPNLILYSTKEIKEGQYIGDNLWMHDLEGNQNILIKFIKNSFSYHFATSVVVDKIAYYTKAGIYITAINQEDEQQLFVSDACNFSWSPDGKYIVYQHCVDNYRIDEEKGTLWIINTETQEKRQLTYNQFNLIIN